MNVQAHLVARKDAIIIYVPVYEGQDIRKTILFMLYGDTYGKPEAVMVLKDKYLVRCKADGKGDYIKEMASSRDEDAAHLLQYVHQRTKAIDAQAAT